MIFKNIHDRIININSIPNVSNIYKKKSKSRKQENLLGFLGTLIDSMLAKYNVIWAFVFVAI